MAWLFAPGLILSAATLVWDGNQSVAGLQDGGGSWNSTDMDRWYNQSTTGYQAWNNANGDTAVFGVTSTTTPSTVTLAEPFTVGGVVFAPTGTGGIYTVTGSGSNKLTFAGATTPTIAINHTSARINAGISGTQGLSIIASANSNILYFEGSVTNDYTGTTTIDGGVLRLAKTDGATAIQEDIVVNNGGTLYWERANQIADTASVTINAGGVLWLRGQTETIKNLTLNGGNSNGGTGSNGGTFTVTDVLTVNGSGSLGLNSAANWSTSRLELNAGATVNSALSITGNSTSAISTLTVGSGGLEVNNRQINLNSGNNDGSGNPTLGVRGSQILLKGNAQSSGDARIQKSGNNVGVAQLNLDNTTRTWTVVSDTTRIAVSIVGSGGLRKEGLGQLTYGGGSGGSADANTYTGMTTIDAGTLRLEKSSGVDAIAGDVTVNTGGILTWGGNHQLKDTSSIYLNGGSLRFENRNEVLGNIYQSSGTVNDMGVNGGKIEVTGVVQITGGSALNLNSSGEWIVNRLDVAATKTGQVLALTGNSSTNINRFRVESGGMSLTGQSIQLNKGADAGRYGSELVLRGTFTGTGTNQIHAGNLTGSGVARVNLSGGQRTLDIQSGTTTVNTSIVSTTLTTIGVDATSTVGGITKTGNGALVLNEENLYTGNTVVNGGTLRLGSNGSINASPRITVASAAFFDVSLVSGGYALSTGKTLEGGGQIQGNTTLGSGAFLTPGTVGADVTETLAFSAGLTLQSGSTTTFELGNAGNHDKLSIAGAFLQEDGAKITILPNGFTPLDGASYELFALGSSATFSSNLGSFLRTGAEDDATDFNLPDISSSGLMWDVSQLQSRGVVSIVPEPGKAVLLLAGLMALMTRRKRA